MKHEYHFKRFGRAESSRWSTKEAALARAQYDLKHGTALPVKIVNMAWNHAVMEWHVGKDGQIKSIPAARHSGRIEGTMTNPAKIKPTYVDAPRWNREVWEETGHSMYDALMGRGSYERIMHHFEQNIRGGGMVTADPGPVPRPEDQGVTTFEVTHTTGYEGLVSVLSSRARERGWRGISSVQVTPIRRTIREEVRAQHLFEVGIVLLTPMGSSLGTSQVIRTRRSNAHVLYHEDWPLIEIADYSPDLASYL